jgi:1-aminocyclopropane-1-carboxylate deaminase
MQIPLQKITDTLLSGYGVNLYILRLDLIHPAVGGNKFFKLKYNLKEAKKQRKDTLLTLGGAYSNHIAATAAAGKKAGFKTIGIIRGEELQAQGPPLKERNPTLKYAEACGMHLHFISREQYRKRDSQEFLSSLSRQFADFYFLPEGGSNLLAVNGCAEILPLIDIPFDFVCCPVGTGGTFAGIISSLKEKQKAIGFSVLKGGAFLENDIRRFIFEKENWELNHDFHFRGYGKYTPALQSFISVFEKQNRIPLEYIYTGKMMFGIYDLIGKNHFPKNSTIVAIHTGGLQGKSVYLPK